MRKRTLLLILCLCLVAIITTACGGGKTAIPSENSAFYYLLAQQNANNNQPPAPEPTPDPEAEKYPLELSQTEFTLNVGATDNITVMLNGEEITETVTYTVDQKAIARVEQGVITGLSVGVATVTVHSDNAEEDKTFTVNVTLPTLELSKSELSIIVGGSEDITVSLEGKTVTEGLKYDVQDEEIAKVENGKVTALAKGSTTVIYNTAFNDTEKDKIQATKLSDVDDTVTYNVFLLSYDEANNTEYFANTGARQCLTTAYAKKNGVVVADNDYCIWWLRSLFPNFSRYVYYVLSDGYFTYGILYRNYYVVRPALWINF